MDNHIQQSAINLAVRLPMENSSRVKLCIMATNEALYVGNL